MVIGTAEETKQATGEALDALKNAPESSTGLAGKEGGVKPIDKAQDKPEKTYRQSEVDALLGKAGQKLQASNILLTTERDALKSQMETLTTEITEAKESITSLTTDIEAMSEDNPDKDALVKLRKEREKELKVLKAERAEIAPSKQEIAKFQRDQLVYTVADEFVTADGKVVDFDAFMTAADKFKLSEREGLQALAETMGLKPKAEVSEEAEEENPLVPPSGRTSGGSEDLSDLSPREKIERGIEKLKKK